MPRPLSEYSLVEWSRLRPVVHWLKTFRYRAITAAYLRRPPRAGDAAAAARALTGRKVLVTVAFGDPQAIAWQAQLLHRYVPKALHVIADNTPDDTMAQAIAAVAERNGLPYLRLPANPWNARKPSASRSHGIALNWIWHNLLRPGEPEAFGFLDDDLFPTAPDDPFAALASQDFFGVVRSSGSRWFLWAGYCMFKFDKVTSKALDFGQDWFNGLDTGGGNWDVLYRHVDRARLQEVESVFTAYKAGIEVEDGPIQWCGTWLHEVGYMGRAELVAEKRSMVENLLAGHLQAPGSVETTSAAEQVSTSFGATSVA
jgi:hypothetical protein